ncbi:MAG: carbohydrate ABC transporter permease [Limnochordales bacterium]|nr:carbohydrate ABC transporter permease [Limnochordales bacterium]
MQASMAVRLRKSGLRIGHALVLLVFVLFTATPFVWMLITSFKHDSDLYNPDNNPLWFNEPPTLAHWEYVFHRTPFLRWLANTTIVGLAVIVITLALALPAAYSLSRLLGRWGERLGIAIFLVYLVPPTLLFIPMARVISSLQLQNTLWSLIVVYPTITVPFSTWLLMGFFKSIPRDLEEAAMIDGCSRLGALARVILPLAVPGIITVIIFSFTLAAQEFIYGLTFVTSTAVKTVSVGVPQDMVRGDIFFWGPLMGSAFLASVPVAILYYLVLDRFIAGFTTAGAFK